MTEPLAHRYQTLFEVWLLHHYWLDEGSQAFDQFTATAKHARLLRYDRRALLGVRPTLATERRLSGYQALIRDTALGFVVLLPIGTQLPVDTVLEFIITIEDSRFYGYTALTLRGQTVYERYNDADQMVYRYKENVPVLSNLSGATRGAGAAKQWFLSRDNPALDTNGLIESLAQSGGALVQLTSDGPGATTQQLAAQATDLPVYVHQGDVPPIVAPPGLTGAPAKGVRLSADVADDVYALISLSARRPDDAGFDFVDAQGQPLASAPLYQVRFKNRSTFWRYLDKQTSTAKSTEPAALPLTYFGNAGTQQKPSSGMVKPELTGAKINRLISEIYV